MKTTWKESIRLSSYPVQPTSKMTLWNCISDSPYETNKKEKTARTSCINDRRQKRNLPAVVAGI